MKKGLCIVLSALVVALSFTACSKKNKDLAEVVTKINDEGKVVVEVTDKDGKAVTNASGEVETSVLSDKEIEAIKKAKGEDNEKKAEDNKENKAEENKKDDKKDNKKEDNNEKIDTTDIAVNPELEKILNDETLLEPVATEDDIIKDKGTATKKTTLFQDEIQPVIKSGKFTITMNAISGGQKSPLKLAFNDGKMYASVNMQGIEMGLIYMDKTAYLVMPNLLTIRNVYLKYPDEEGEFSEMFSSFDEISDNGSNYVGSTKVKVDGKTYTCEEYKSDDGTVFKYYFDGKDWKRYECIAEDGMMVYEINEFSNKVDSKLFSLKGYREIDPKVLESLGNIGA